MKTDSINLFIYCEQHIKLTFISAHNFNKKSNNEDNNNNEEKMKNIHNSGNLEVFEIRNSYRSLIHTCFYQHG